jgi:chemotaxis protein CheZ
VVAAKPKLGASEDMAALRQHLDLARAEIEMALGEAASAADTIIGGAETLLSSKDAAVNDTGLRILEACSFQDVTGQRLRKALGALTRILSGIEHKELGLGRLAEDPARAKWRETNLLHGPAAIGEALDQSAIDDFFK